MNQTAPAAAERGRRIVHRTFGQRHGPVTRLMSPSDLGRRLKPFVFLDLFDADPSAFSGFGWHPHSGIATLTWLWQGNVRYEDTTGGAGFLPAGGVEWFRAAGGAWHGGGGGDAGRSRGFQLWIALPPDQELGPAESRYQEPGEIETSGPASVLLGSLDGVSSRIEAPSPINYLAVRLGAGESWRYEPPAGHDIAWLALASGRLALPEPAEPAEAGELVVFEPSNQPIEIRAEADTEFVLGSAASHPHDLVLGYYSVHTSPASLAAGERRIAEIETRLRQEGVLAAR
jgi:redox-sensitive bicupin YhaK (pirin superfamily)